LILRADPYQHSRMLRAASAVLLLVTLPLPAFAQTMEAELRGAEEQLARALTMKDAAALERLLAADFVMRGAPDVARDAWMKNALTLCWGDQFEISDYAVTRTAGDLAVVSLVLTTHRDPVTCEPAIIRSLLTDIWMRAAGTWRLAVRHSGPAAAAVTAQFAKTAPPPPRWERTGELSLISTGGNTDTQTLGAGAGFIWRPGQWTTRTRAAYIRNSTQDVLTAESFVAEVRQARVLSPRADVFARAEYLVDRFSGIDHRTTVDGGLGWLVFDDGQRSLKTDGALGVTSESRLQGEDLTFASASGIALFKWQFSPTAAVIEQASLSTDVSDVGNWRLHNGLNLTVTINRILAARVGHELKRLNRPVPGFKRTDTTLSAALVAKF
jgi:putative salt-induced outer membrane protein